MKRSDNLFNRNRQSKPKFAQRKSIQLQDVFFRLIIFPLAAKLERRNFNVQGEEFFFQSAVVSHNGGITKLRQNLDYIIEDITKSR